MVSRLCGHPGVDIRPMGKEKRMTEPRAVQNVSEEEPGGIVPAAGSLASLRDLEERVRDRTSELERVNLELRRERLRLDLVLQQIPAAVMVVDAAGQIVLTNRNMEELFAALGGPRPRRYTDLRLLNSEGRPYRDADRPLTQALRNGRETMGERFQLALSDGRMRAVEMSVAPLREEDGTISSAVLTTVDITEREQRERADREFLANAAHQLRTPLAAIRGAVEVLQAGAKDDPETRDRFLAHIERESERLTRLARALLTLARAQSQREELRTEIVLLEPVLRDVVGRIDPPPGIALELRCPPELAALSSPELLEESLTCLADNAVRYAQHQIVLEGRHEGPNLIVEVRDDGPGMPREEQERVFERFYRARDGSGFGLGLAIAAQAAEAMGATLEIVSRPGTGTAARLVVPAVHMLAP
jgi:PAS domain S-box-containing protein